MPEVGANEDEGACPGERTPDAHGEAALLLAESILHILVDTGTLTPAQALEAVEIAGEVKRAVAGENGESDVSTRRAPGLLSTIAATFEIDM